VETLLITDKEASRLLRISRSKFHVLVAEGRIPRLKLGRSARYRRVDVLAFVERLAAEQSNVAPYNFDEQAPDRSQRPLAK